MSPPLPSLPPAPRRPPVPPGIAVGVLVAAVFGLIVVLRGPSATGVPTETAVLPAASPGLGPFGRAAIPRADGFADPLDAPVAVATGIVVEASPAGGTVVLLHRIDAVGDLEGESPSIYFSSRYAVETPTVTVGDPVARGQGVALKLLGNIVVSRVELGQSGKKKTSPGLSVEELLINNPQLASPQYPLPPFPPLGGGSPLIFQNQQ